MCTFNTELAVIKDYYGSYQHIIDLLESEANVIAREACECKPSWVSVDTYEWSPEEECGRCVQLNDIAYQIYIAECMQEGNCDREPEYYYEQ
jgi:hypothetical protein